MNNESVPKSAFGCSIRSLLLMTTICAALFAIIGTAARSERPDTDGTMEMGKEFAVGAIVVLPFLGLLVGHVRFHRLRYVFLGGLFGLLTGILLLVVLSIPPVAAPGLLITTAVACTGLIAYGIYVRRAQS